MRILLPGGLRIGVPSGDEVQRLLERARRATLSYDGVGRTLGNAPIPGEHRETIEVGQGKRAFTDARDALRAWTPQRRLGAVVVPERQPVEIGATVLLVIRRGPLGIVAPVRVVEVVDEPRRFAYAYGTLPGHPGCGEEAFTVEWQADDRVTASVRVAARPATRALRLAAPLVRAIQRAALRRYLQAVAERVAAGRSDQASAPGVRSG